MVRKKGLYVVLLGIVLPVVNYGMEQKKRLSSHSTYKRVKAHVAIEQIDESDLPSLIGTSVLFKKNDNNAEVYEVRLGMPVLGTDLYQIYYNDHAGECSPAGSLYRYRKE